MKDDFNICSISGATYAIYFKFDHLSRYGEPRVKVLYLALASAWEDGCETRDVSRFLDTAGHKRASPVYAKQMAGDKGWRTM